VPTFPLGTDMTKIAVWMYSILHHKCGEQYGRGEELVGRGVIKNQRFANKVGHARDDAGPNKLDLPDV
jgi:hypothetical protein